MGDVTWMGNIEGLERQKENEDNYVEVEKPKRKYKKKEPMEVVEDGNNNS